MQKEGRSIRSAVPMWICLLLKAPIPRRASMRLQFWLIL